MKRILILLLALLPIATMAQRVPDNEAILARTIDNSTPYYYPRLMERYIHGDTTLTLDEYHHLYYGFAFADNYRPLENDPARIDVLEVFVGYSLHGACLLRSFHEGDADYRVIGYGSS